MTYFILTFIGSVLGLGIGWYSCEALAWVFNRIQNKTLETIFKIIVFCACLSGLIAIWVPEEIFS